MISIFYDLETSDRDFVGQILSFSFIAVDERFQSVGELSGTIGLTSLQVPSLGALLTNRIKVLDHKAQYTERQAAVEIARFLGDWSSRGDPIALVGFNNFRFDLQFVRTVLIRNGISPYNLGGPLIHRDLYPLVQYLAATNNSFPIPVGEDGRRSLSLENVTKRLDLLTGIQTHDARDDVLLEIKLAQHLHAQFGVHVADFDVYTLPRAGRAPAEQLTRGALYFEISPNRDDDPSRAVLKPYLLIDNDGKASLWCDLSAEERHEKTALRYRKKNGGALFLAPYSAATLKKYDCLVRAPGSEKPEPLTFAELDSKVSSLVPKISELHQKVLLANYFDREPECDIEQFIYRLDTGYIPRLHRALFDGDERAVRDAQDKDLSVLLTRAKLATADVTDAAVLQKLRAYGAYRYSGKMLLSRFADDPQPRYTATREQLLSEVNTVPEDEVASDKEIREQLAEYYRVAPVLSGW